METFYDVALKAINEMFGDTSVSQSEALADLRGLKDEINVMIDALEDDMKQETGDQENLKE